MPISGTDETEDTMPLSLVTFDYLCSFQGLMFGYVTDETKDTMPLSLITFDYLCLFQELMKLRTLCLCP